MLHWVFAYGSNMDLDDVERWCHERGHEPIRILDAQVAELPGFALAWNYYSDARQGAAANVEERAGRSLPGLVLQVSATGLGVLDRKEGHPKRYRRRLLRVVTAKESAPSPPRAFGESGAARAPDAAAMDAWVYQVQPEFLRPQPQHPTSTYVNIMLRAAERHGFPGWYLRELRALLR
ncbi:MAG TPA: gamma-glutamylcyclotransferase [Polyangiaceae bacterium]|nr:gamma-glutamylcyclotransferase [Polyangiaceae bacterium]HMR77440.1 gamma-glutamylcyclotransferase [Polyangiaceae bacterium]